MKPRITGVYVISLGSEKVYVGSSRRCVANRISWHKANLRAGRAQQAMQRDFDTFGVFTFKVVPCAAEEAYDLEQRKMNYYRARNRLYNLAPKARSNTGLVIGPSPSYAAKAKQRCTPEWRAAVSERVKRQHQEGRFGYDLATAKKRTKWDRSKPHGLKGRKQSPEHIAAVQYARANPKEK